MRRQVRDFRDTMNHAQQQQQPAQGQGQQGAASQPQRPSSNTSKAGDYIDFEEIK